MLDSNSKELSEKRNDKMTIKTTTIVHNQKYIFSYIFTVYQVYCIPGNSRFQILLQSTVLAVLQKLVHDVCRFL